MYAIAYEPSPANVDQLVHFSGEARRSRAGGRGRPKTDDSPRLNSDEGYGASATRTDTAVGEVVGLKRDKYRKVKAVYDTAKDEKQPAPIRDLAAQQMAALDTGETTAHAAEKAVWAAQGREKVRPLPAPAPLADPFADVGTGSAEPVANIGQRLSL